MTWWIDGVVELTAQRVRGLFKLSRRLSDRSRYDGELFWSKENESYHKDDDDFGNAYAHTSNDSKFSLEGP